VPSTSSAPLPVQKRAWDTRTRILEAAVACLAEDGYAAATTSRIQERAGVSRGSLLHQFPAKDDLLIAAVQHLASARTADLEGQSHRTEGDIDAAIEALWDTLHGPLFSATVELWVAARHSPDLAAALAPHEHELGRTIRAQVAELFGARLAARSGFGDFVALLVTSMRGVALTYTFEQRDPGRDAMLGLWKAMARRYLEGDPAHA
jgi:AcrR family transcriptional regulator